MPRSELETHLRSATPAKRYFILSSEAYLKNNGQCAVDQLDKI